MNKVYSAKYGDYLLSLFGACVVAFGLGAAAGSSLGNYGWLLVIIGAGLHGIGMYRTRGSH